jgi:hypothetical protein
MCAQASAHAVTPPARSLGATRALTLPISDIAPSSRLLVSSRPWVWRQSVKVYHHLCPRTSLDPVDCIVDPRDHLVWWTFRRRLELRRLFSCPGSTARRGILSGISLAVEAVLHPLSGHLQMLTCLVVDIIRKRPPSDTPQPPSCTVPPCRLTMGGVGWSLPCLFPGAAKPLARDETRNSGPGRCAVVSVFRAAEEVGHRNIRLCRYLLVGDGVNLRPVCEFAHSCQEISVPLLALRIDSCDVW